jgi:hypothetical protein
MAIDNSLKKCSEYDVSIFSANGAMVILAWATTLGSL